MLSTLANKGRGSPDSIIDSAFGNPRFRTQESYARERLEWMKALSDRKPYIGYALQAIDAKGRVAIPADLRGQLEANGADKRVFVDFHRDDACLIGFDTGWLATLREKLARDEVYKRSLDADYDLDLELRASVVSAEAVAFDASGRFIMPPFLRETAGFGDWAFFSGAIDNFEIWNPADLLSNPRAPDRAKRVLAWAMKQKGLA